jgi:hypothetical protein
MTLLTLYWIQKIEYNDNEKQIPISMNKWFIQPAKKGASVSEDRFKNMILSVENWRV